MTPEQIVEELLKQGGQCCTPRCISAAKVVQALTKMRRDTLKEVGQAAQEECSDFIYGAWEDILQRVHDKANLHIPPSPPPSTKDDEQERWERASQESGV